MHIAQECSKPFNICFGLPKNSIFTDPMSEIIVRLKEAGIVNKFFKDEMDSVAKVADNQDAVVVANAGPGYESALNMDHLQGAFVILLISLAGSLLVFIGESLRDTRPVQRSFGELWKY